MALRFVPISIRRRSCEAISAQYSLTDTQNVVVAFVVIRLSRPRDRLMLRRRRLFRAQRHASRSEHQSTNVVCGHVE